MFAMNTFKTGMVGLSVLLLAACGDTGSSTTTTDSTNTGSATGDAQVIKIATEGAYAPFNFTNADGSLGGFDVDVANALCDKMQVTCQIQAQDWDGIIPALKSGKFDAIVAAMSVTPERSEQVDFTDPYFTNTLVFLAKDDKAFDPTNQADIQGNAIAAQRSTISSQWLEATYPGVETRLYDTLDNAFLDLGAGRVEVMISDKLPAVTWLKTDLGKGFGIKGNDIQIDDNFAIAVNKGKDELRAQFNEALAQIKADGTYDALVVKHFGAEMLPTAQGAAAPAVASTADAPAASQ